MQSITARTADGRTVCFDTTNATHWNGPTVGFNIETVYRIGSDWVLCTAELLAAGDPPLGEVITEEAALVWLLRHHQKIPSDMIVKAEAIRLT